MIDNRENNIWTVYVHIVPKTITEYDYDKYYVGITSRPVEKRWRWGWGYYNQPFFRVVKKYGWDNIEHYIIAEHLTEDEAKEFEKILINKLDSNINNGKHGYNITDGGDGMCGFKHSQESKEKMSKHNSRPFLGKKHTEETKRKISIGHLKYKDDKHPQAQHIYQFDINGNYINDYTCIKYAAKALGLKNLGCHISHGALQHHKAYGYLWAYKKDIVIINNIPKLNWIYKEKEIRASYRHVYQFDLNGNFIKDYKTCRDASKETKIKEGSISHVAIGNQKTAGGYFWRYEKDINLNKDNIPILSDSYIYKRKKKELIPYDRTRKPW